jgi:signal transduction histidine kinase
MPSAVGLVVTLLLGSWAVPGVMASAFIINLVTLYTPERSASLIVACAISAAGAGLHAYLGALFLKRWAQHPHHPFDGVRDVAVLVVCVALAGSMINATTGVTIQTFGKLASRDLLSGWVIWWLDDAARVLGIVPLLLIWRKLPSFDRRQWVEFTALLAVIVACWRLMLLIGYSAEYFFIPLLILAVYRLGGHGGSAAMFAIGTISIVGVKHGTSSFMHDDPTVTIILLQVFLCMMSSTWLIVGAVVRERETARNALSYYSRDLEHRVRQRTAELESANAALRAENDVRRHTEQALLQAKRAAEAANEAKSTFLATMSHEIRTPIHAIIGFTELQLEGIVGELNPKQREYQQRVIANARDLLIIINDVLDLSRIEAGEMALRPEEFKVREWLAGLVEQYQVLAQQKGLAFATAVDHHVPLVIEGDPGRLRQIVANLVSNAIKFTESGSVTIFMHRPDDATLHIQVADTGIGIPPDRIDHIFDDFYQVDSSSTRRYGGSGLGLAIVRRMTGVMGGRLSVISEVGMGSTFILAIPVQLR